MPARWNFWHKGTRQLDSLAVIYFVNEKTRQKFWNKEERGMSCASYWRSGIAFVGRHSGAQRYRGNYRSDFRGALLAWDCSTTKWATLISTPFDGAHIALRNNLPMLLAFRQTRCGAGSNGAKNHRARLARCCALSSRSQNYWKPYRLQQHNCDRVIITR